MKTMQHGALKVNAPPSTHHRTAGTNREKNACAITSEICQEHNPAEAVTPSGSLPHHPRLLHVMLPSLSVLAWGKDCGDAIGLTDMIERNHGWASVGLGMIKDPPTALSVDGHRFSGHLLPSRRITSQ